MKLPFGRCSSVLVPLVPLLLAASPCLAQPVVVFSTDFSAGIPAELSAPGCQLDGVQGFAGLGPPERTFSGNFLRYTSVPIDPTTLTVRNLPAHDHLSLKFLLGVIDSWDGTELMQVYVDGSLKFNHWFQLAVGDTTDYFPAPAGAILSMGRDLGFSGCCYYNRDRAYDLGVEPAFLDIAHTADSVVVTWTVGAISGPAADQWQGGADESWAIDAVSVEVSNSTVDVADGPAPGGVGLRAWPNPARNGFLRLQLSIPTPGPVRVELLDIAGRRVASRDLEMVGPGWREVDLLGGRRIAPGLYLARLQHGGQVQTARVVVTR